MTLPTTRQMLNQMLSGHEAVLLGVAKNEPFMTMRMGASELRGIKTALRTCYRWEVVKNNHGDLSLTERGEELLSARGYVCVNGHWFKPDHSKRIGGFASTRETYIGTRLREYSISPCAAKEIVLALTGEADGDGGPGYEFCWCGDPEPHAVEQGHYLNCEINADICRWLNEQARNCEE